MAKAAAKRDETDLPESDRLGTLPHPRSTADLIGHDAAEQDILETITSGRVPHGWLITGPKGIGKATLAYRFARTILKHGASAGANLGTLQVAPEDPVFRRIEAGSHGDLLVLRRPYDEKSKKFRSAIPVEDVRRINSFFGHHAGAGGWRVCIVDAADDMNQNAANALLKVLEEPPAHSIFLLVCHAPGRILPTIKSRCRRLALKPVSEEAIAALLTDQTPEDAAAVARLAKGSIGRALMLAEDDGLTLYRKLAGLLIRMPEISVADLHKFADEVAARGKEDRFRAATAFLIEWLERMIRSCASGESVADIVPGEGAAMARLARPETLEVWVETWERCKSMFAQGEALHLDPKHLMLTTFFRLQETAKQ